MSKFDFKRYPAAMIQFGPSFPLEGKWISLGSLETVEDLGDGTLLLSFKSGHTLTLTAEQSEQFHKFMNQGADQIEAQIQDQRAQQAQAMGRQLGIIKGN